MELDGTSERVLLRTYQMHPYKPQVLHIDFQRVSEDTPIHMRVPLHFVGQESSPAVKISAAIVIPQN
jgi:large subunit ribosomal protein L25